jgi:hypothetical protein
MFWRAFWDVADDMEGMGSAAGYPFTSTVIGREVVPDGDDDEAGGDRDDESMGIRVRSILAGMVS